MTGQSTRSVHSGMPVPLPGQPLMPGPVFAAPYYLDPEGVQPGTDGYGRPNNATRRLLEDALSELEGGPALAFASGMGAVTALLMSVLKPGDTVMVPSDGYFQTRAFAKSHFASVKLVPTLGPYDFTGVRLAVIETPSNPWLDTVDIAALAQQAHDAGALLAVDNTAATPLLQQPLTLGADVVVASGTKALCGHSDLLIGYIATQDPTILAGMREWRDVAGVIPSPFDCWLARRSMSTLALRLRQQGASGVAIAALLRSHPLVSDVRWSSLAPGLVSFTLPSRSHVATFLRTARYVAAATSFGGVHTSADRREQWGDDTPPGFVRLSCGIEDTEDLLADVTAALAALK